MSIVKGYGIQYLPHHKEKFVDYVVNRFDKKNLELLEVAGGGLRFASKIKKAKIIVNDLDPTSLKEIKKIYCPKKNINFILGDFFKIKKKLKNRRFNLLVSFRFIHFFNKKRLEKFFKIACMLVKKNGYLIVSSFFYNKKNKNSLELINLSNPISSANPYFRKIKKRKNKNEFYFKMNLNNNIFLANKNFLNMIAKKYSFKLLKRTFYSTRMVRGFILKKI